MEVTWYGHATAGIRSGEHEFLIDPFFSGNPVAVTDPETLSPDYIIVTHGHADHVADVEDIGKRSGAQLISCPEICGWFAAKGLDNAHEMNIGGYAGFPFGRVKFTPAFHSSSLPDGTYGGMPMGVLLELDGRNVYHAGDTALFSDMELIGAAGLELAFLPIGGNFTMGPEEALDAVRLLRPKTVVPIHYDTFPPIRQDAEAFRRLVEEQTDARCLVPEPGATFSI
ncbi:MAG TPA: metal-dependent hydrolase [Deinococcales bacterium]|nr:metal-dependent hydrolase [Deinococcales bacterium]